MANEIKTGLNLKFDYLKRKKATGAEAGFSPTDITTPFGRAEERMADPRRIDYFDKALANITTPIESPARDIPIRAAAVPLQTFLGGTQRLEALGANPIMEAQELGQRVEESREQLKDVPVIGDVPFILKQASQAVGTAKTTGRALKSVYQALSGEKLGEYGDVYVRAGMSEKLAKPLGLYTFAALSGGLGLLSKKFAGGVGHTDKLMTQQGNSIVTGVKGKLKTIRSAYDEILEPHLKQVTPADDIAAIKVDSQMPKFIQKIVNKYSSGVVDQFGNKTITLEGLRKMFWDVSSKKGKEFILAKNAIKKAIIKHLPKDAQNKYLTNDKAFEGFIETGNTILRHLTDGPRIKTEVIARFFKNPDHAGSRELFRSLKDFGIGVEKAIKTYTSYATRQAQKKFIGRAGEYGAPLGILGSIIRGGIRGKDDTMAPSTGG